MRLLDVQIGEFANRIGERCKVTLKSYKGKQRVDVRVHFEDEDGEWQPTKKGLNISVDDLPTLRRLITEAEQKAVHAGVLDPADHTNNE